MSQLVACSCSNGVVLASDRRVVLQKDDTADTHSIRKLYPLGRTAAVATGGAAIGIEVSRTLSRLLRKRTLPTFGELDDYVMGVYQKEYSGFVDQGASWFAAHPEAHRRSFVLLGGRSDTGFAYRFYASESHEERYRALPTSTALTAPRRLGLEGSLARTAADGCDLDQLAELAITGLRRVAEHEASVAGPFDVAVIGRAGTRLATFE